MAVTYGTCCCTRCVVLARADPTCDYFPQLHCGQSFEVERCCMSTCFGIVVRDTIVNKPSSMRRVSHGGVTGPILCVRGRAAGHSVTVGMVATRTALPNNERLRGISVSAG